MIDPAKYPLRIFPSEEDGGFIAEAIDLPGCSAFGETSAEACSELQDAIVAWIGATTAAGNHIPPPSDMMPSVFSGRLAVRLPRQLHANLSQQARAEGVSLNSYLISVLATGAEALRKNAVTVVNDKFYAAAEYHSILISNVALNNKGWFQTFPTVRTLPTADHAPKLGEAYIFSKQMELTHG